MTTINAAVAAALAGRLTAPVSVAALVHASGYSESTIRRLLNQAGTLVDVTMLMTLDEALARLGRPGLLAEVIGDGVMPVPVAAGDVALWVTERGEALHAPHGLRAMAVQVLGLDGVAGDAAAYARRVLGWIGVSLRDDGVLSIDLERGMVEAAGVTRLRDYALRHAAGVRRVVINMHQGPAAVTRDYAWLGAALDALDRATVSGPVVGQHLLVSARESALALDGLDPARRFLLDLPVDASSGEVLSAAARCGMLDRTAMVRVGDDGSVRLLYAGEGVRIRQDAVGREAGEMDDVVYGEALRRDMRRALDAGRSFTRVDLAAADARASYTRSAIRAAGGLVVTTNLVDAAPPGSRVG